MTRTTSPSLAQILRESSPKGEEHARKEEGRKSTINVEDCSSSKSKPPSFPAQKKRVGKEKDLTSYKMYVKRDRIEEEEGERSSGRTRLEPLLKKSQKMKKKISIG